MKSNCAILILLGLFSVFGEPHEGHDHSHDNQEDAGNSPGASIPETDKQWSKPDVHSSPLGKVQLKWQQDPLNSSYVLMKMSARTSGYVAVGFCPVWQGTMGGCDIALGWVDLNQVAYIGDYYATGNTSPQLDKSQDYELISGSEKDGITSIVFKRKWQTADDDNDANLLHNSAVHIIYASNDEDPNNKASPKYHAGSNRWHTTKAVAIKNHQHGNGGTKVLENKTVLLLSILYLFAKASNN